MTSESTLVQKNILEIIEKCAIAFHEKIQSSEDGGQDTIESEIVAKKSVVFSLLEVCTFLVSKYAKDLVISSGLSTGNVSRKPGDLFFIFYVLLSQLFCVVNIFSM